MTIQFNCPQCNALIAFADQHAGKRAKCATCQQRLIIPAKSLDSPVRVKEVLTESDVDTQPAPGFYRAAILEGWGLFFRKGNLVPLAFVITAVCFKFFYAYIDYSFVIGVLAVNLKIGLFIRITCWGFLFWLYLEIINTTAVAESTIEMPTIDIDGYFEFFCNAFRSVFMFAVAIIICTVPTVVVLSLGQEYRATMLPTLATNVGLFFLPMLLLALGINRDSLKMFRVDTMIKPMFKAIGAYLLCALLIMLLAQLQISSKNWGDSALEGAATSIKLMHLGMQLGLQVLAILSMRSLGLLYRHYVCYFKW